jgi:hypothetical protein
MRGCSFVGSYPNDDNLFPKGTLLFAGIEWLRIEAGQSSLRFARGEDCLTVIRRFHINHNSQLCVAIFLTFEPESVNHSTRLGEPIRCLQMLKYINSFPYREEWRIGSAIDVDFAGPRRLLLEEMGCWRHWGNRTEIEVISEEGMVSATLPTRFGERLSTEHQKAIPDEFS